MVMILAGNRLTAVRYILLAGVMRIANEGHNPNVDYSKCNRTTVLETNHCNAGLINADRNI